MDKIMLVFVLGLIFYGYKSCEKGVDSAKTFFKEKNIEEEQRATAFNQKLILFLNNEVSLLKDRTKYDQAINEFKIKDPTFLVLVALIEKTRKENQFSMKILEMELDDLIRPETPFKPLVRPDSPLSFLGHVKHCLAEIYPDCDRFVLYLKKNKFKAIFKHPLDGTQEDIVEASVKQKIQLRDVRFLKLYKEYFPEEFEKIIY